jgi:hypothetical protein
MKIKIRPDNASVLQKTGWFQMEGWLAELREDGRGEPAEDGGPGPGALDTAAPDGSTASAETLSPAETGARAEADAPAETEDPAEADAPAETEDPAEADAPAETGARAEADAPAETEDPAETGATAETEVPAQTGASAQAGDPPRVSAPAGAGPAVAAPVRAVIGDELRMPIMWCEMGSCISWYRDPAALGEADTRARAIGAGWRIDALGRLTCPECQQTDPRFWASCTVVPWDRYTAIARTTRITYTRNEAAVAGAAVGISRDPGRAASDYRPPVSAELEWHHDYPSASGRTRSADRRAERPTRAYVPVAWL